MIRPDTRGFTLTELLAALTIMGVLGVAMMRILINDSRFVSRQDAMLTTRQAARAAMHTAVAELHSVDTVFAVAEDSVVVGVPFAWGVVCEPNVGGVAVVSLIPGDSAAYASSVSPNVRVARKAPGAGTYTYHTAVRTVSASTNMAACTTDSIRVLTGGKLIQLQPVLAGANNGDILYLYQKITYQFRNSTDPSLSGRRALFRRDQTGTLEELVAPFDTSAKFRCLTGPDLAKQDCSAVSLTNVRGLELKLVTASDRKPQGSNTYQMFDLSTRIIFANRIR